jgi:hypothetical protein
VSEAAARGGEGGRPSSSSRCFRVGTATTDEHTRETYRGCGRRRGKDDSTDMGSHTKVHLFGLQYGQKRSEVARTDIHIDERGETRRRWKGPSWREI